MKSNSANANVTINIKKSDSEDATSISLSRWQFESIVIGVPACLVSGVVAVGILIFDVTTRPKNVGQNSGAQYAENLNRFSNPSGVQTEPLAASQVVVTSDSLAKASKHNSKGSAAGGAALNESFEEAKSSVAGSRSSSLTADVASENTSLKGSQGESAKNQDERVTGKVNGEVTGAVYSEASLLASSQDAQSSVVSSAKDNSGAKYAGAEKSFAEIGPTLSVIKNIKVDDIYDVSARVYQTKSDSPILAKISMKNLTGNKEKGRLWLKVLVGSGDEEQWLSSQINLPADESMNVKGARIGKIYVFQTWVEHELSLGVPRIQAKEIKEIIFGAETERHGQKVAKIDLRADSDTRSGM